MSKYSRLNNLKALKCLIFLIKSLPDTFEQAKGTFEQVKKNCDISKKKLWHCILKNCSKWKYKVIGTNSLRWILLIRSVSLKSGAKVHCQNNVPGHFS